MSWAWPAVTIDGTRELQWSAMALLIADGARYTAIATATFVNEMLITYYVASTNNQTIQVNLDTDATKSTVFILTAFIVAGFIAAIPLIFRRQPYRTKQTYLRMLKRVSQYIALPFLILFATTSYSTNRSANDVYLGVFLVSYSVMEVCNVFLRLHDSMHFTEVPYNNFLLPSFVSWGDMHRWTAFRDALLLTEATTLFMVWVLLSLYFGEVCSGGCSLDISRAIVGLICLFPLFSVLD